MYWMVRYMRCSPLLGSFNLSTARKVVCDKYQVDPQTPMLLSYTAPDGMEIDLEDAEDFRAFQVYASRESVVTVNVEMDAANVGISKPTTDPSLHTPSKPRSRRGTRGKGASAPPPAPAPATDASAPIAEDTPAENREAPASGREAPADGREAPADGREAPVAADATPKESGRKRKQKKVAEKDTEKEADKKAKKQKENEPVQEAPAAPPTADSDDDSDDDLPLSQSAPPSSQTNPPLSQESVSEKPRRHRRTKAEMEAFRAEQAAKKLEKEQARQNKASHPVPTDTTAEPEAAGDETTIIHEPRNDEYVSAASSAVQALVEEGSAAMQQRLNDLKAKKQRKNAAEREEQKLLMGLVGKESSASDTTMREYAVCE